MADRSVDRLPVPAPSWSGAEDPRSGWPPSDDCRSFSSYRQRGRGFQPFYGLLSGRKDQHDADEAIGRPQQQQDVCQGRQAEADMPALGVAVIGGGIKPAPDQPYNAQNGGAHWPPIDGAEPQANQERHQVFQGVDLNPDGALKIRMAGHGGGDNL